MEKQIQQLAAKGLTMKEAAITLKLSYQTLFRRMKAFGLVGCFKNGEKAAKRKNTIVQKKKELTLQRNMV